VYSQASTNTPNHLSSNSSDYQRVGEQAQTGSVLIGKVLTQIQIWIKSNNSATGTATCTIRKGTDDSIATTMGTIDVTTISSNMTLYNFTNNTNAYAIAVNDKILLEYSATSNNIAPDESNSGTVDTTKTCAVRYQSGSYSIKTSNDFCGNMWTA